MQSIELRSCLLCAHWRQYHAHADAGFCGSATGVFSGNRVRDVFGCDDWECDPEVLEANGGAEGDPCQP